MFRWMLGFVVVALVAGFLSSAFNLVAAQTVSVICLVLAVLLLVSAMFEKTAAA